MMHAIIDASILARVSFRDPDEVHRFWRYLNLIHCSAYTGLSPTYTAGNFFEPVVKRHDLIPERVKGEETAAIDAIANSDGLAAVNIYEIWALEVVQMEAIRNDGKLTRLAPAIHARLNEKVDKLSRGAKRLHAYTFQVLPFIYTHLVSLSSVREAGRGSRTAFVVGR